MLPLLSWLLVGLVVGFVARAIVPGRQPLGLVLTIALGVVGAVVGGAISSLLWPAWSGEPDVNRMWPGWLMSIAGAVLVLWVYVGLTGRRTLTTRY